MANISHFTQTVNGVSTTYNIHDANAIPRSGGRVTGNLNFISNWNYASSNQGWFPSTFNWYGGNNIIAYISIYDDPRRQIVLNVTDHNGVMKSVLSAGIDENNNIIVLSNNKNLAMQQDTVPRSLGAVVSGNGLYKTTNNSYLELGGGTNLGDGATISYNGATKSSYAGYLIFTPNNGSVNKVMYLSPDGTWTWDGTACQITSDQRYKQQITEIDDKLLDAWEDVELVQFKYNDAVDQKKDKARLHTGYVVQQIDSACKSHNVDVSQYGLYCHEEYPQETEEIEVEQADGTKTKERKVIREASEHYSLRYTEVYAVECMYLRRCIARLTARIEQLEKEQEASK